MNNEERMEIEPTFIMGFLTKEERKAALKLVRSLHKSKQLYFNFEGERECPEPQN